MRHITAILALALLLGAMLWSAPAQAKDKEEARTVHPLIVVRADIENTELDGFRSYRGRCVVTIKNVSSDNVDGIKAKLILRDGSREIRNIEKEVEAIDAGKRRYVNFKWEDVDKRNLTPQLWITYKDENGEEVTFQGRPPQW